MNHRYLFMGAILSMGALAAVATLLFPKSSKAHIVFPDGFVVRATIADTPARQHRGLSGTKVLQKDEGMLFLFDEATKPGFVMRDMLIPLDIIWLSANTVVGYEEHLQPENPIVHVYRPPVAVTGALEVPAGFVAAHGLAFGNALDIRLKDR